MEISRETAPGGVVILTIKKGKILIGDDAECLRSAVQQEVDAHTPYLFLNYGGVRYLDSGGLAETVRCYTNASRVGTTLRFIDVTRKVKGLLKTTKLLGVLPIRTLEEALAEVE